MAPDKKIPAENILHEEAVAYQHAEARQLAEALHRTHTQRFEFMMELIKAGEMMKRASITHKDMNEWISSTKK